MGDAQIKSLSGACVGVVLLMLMFASSARAEVRSATIADAQDATPSLSGQPNEPDIRQVSAAYDSTSGTFTFTIDFYNSLNSLSFNPSYAWFGKFGIANCNGTGAQITGQNHIASNEVRFYDQYEVSGFSGEAALTRTQSPDGKRVQVTGQNPAIVGRDYTCFSYFIASRNRSTASNPSSRYDESCDCWYVFGPTDYIGSDPLGVGTGGSIYFDGFGPPPKEPKPPKPSKKCRQAPQAVKDAEFDVRWAKRYLKDAIRYDYGPNVVANERRRLRQARKDLKAAKRVLRKCERQAAGSGRIALLPAEAKSLP